MPPASVVSPAHDTAHANALRRILGLGFGLAVIVGSTLGIGILRTPGLVAGQLSSPHRRSCSVWIVGGLYTLLGAVCFAELGTMLPKEGGYYVYARRAFGDTVGFAVGWTDWLTYCAVLGYVSIGFGEFAGVARAVARAVGHARGGRAARRSRGAAVGGRAGEQPLSADRRRRVKFVAFLALVVAAFLVAPASPPRRPPQPATASIAGLIVALQAVVITYGGWQSALYFSEEDRDPERNIPRSMIGGVAAVIVVYLLVNIALLWVLPIGDLARSTLPAADAAQVLVGGRGRGSSRSSRSSRCRRC